MEVCCTIGLGADKCLSYNIKGNIMRGGRCATIPNVSVVPVAYENQELCSAGNLVGNSVRNGCAL